MHKPTVLSLVRNLSWKEEGLTWEKQNPGGLNGPARSLDLTRSEEAQGPTQAGSCYIFSARAIVSSWERLLRAMEHQQCVVCCVRC